MRYLLTLLCMTLSMTGCGNGQSGQSTAGNTRQSTSQAAPDSQVSSAGKDSVAPDAPSLPHYTETDRKTVERILHTACTQYASWGKEKTILWIARQFVGMPYVGHTLDQSDTEQMVINLHQLDCTTYVEAVLALTRCAMEGKASFADYCHEAQQVRYRAGKVSYENRLHYFQWWVADNERKGMIEEISSPASLFTGRQRLRIDYMSTHAESYDMLRQHPERVDSIARQEREWLGKTVSYIPKNRLNDPELRKVVHDGDIIGLVTNKAGLDASHLGIAVWHKDGLYLLNASSLKRNGKQVVEPTETLFHYLAGQGHNTGIRVLRIR